MRVALLCLAIMAVFAQQGSAAIVLSIAQSAPGPILVGNTVDFTVSVATDTGSVNNLVALGFTINAGPSNALFVSGTGIYAPGTHTFTGPPPLGTLPASLVGYNYSALAGQTFTTTPTQFASFRMSTTGANVGTFAVTISAADSADLSFNSITTIAPAPFSYSIVPVPEPSSMLLTMGALAFGGRQIQKRRRK